MQLNGQTEQVSIRNEFPSKLSSNLRLINKHKSLYILLILPLAYIIIFKYIPMYGYVLAFKDFSMSKGIFASPWVGMKYFNKFFESPQFILVLKNTLTISILTLIVSFPAPIVLAIALNETKNAFFKKTVQMVTYTPYFISTVVAVGMVMQVLSLRGGMLNTIIKAFGGTAQNFMGNPGIFSTIYVSSHVWQYTGYGAVIYIAALAGVDPNLYEAAIIDGASRFKKMIHVDLPAIMPTVIITLIINAGSIMNVAYEKILLMQNPLNMGSSDVILTYVYRIGLENAQYSFSTAVSLFNSGINFILVIIVNQLAKKFGETSLF